MATVPASKPIETILGLDLGVGSIGWSLVQQPTNWADSSGIRIHDIGVRIFPAGSEGDYSTGRESSLAAPRRQARSMRRQRDRRRRRLISLAHALQKRGFLPIGPVETPAERDAFFKKLDAQLRPPAKAPTVEHHTWLYRLFAHGLTGASLEPYQLGRVLYHAAQLRGFQSNAKERAKATQDKKAGAVYDGIKTTRSLLTQTSTSHLVSALAQLDPEADGQRIRGRYTAREDRRADVLALLDAQTPHHPNGLSESNRNLFRDLIFHQRDLRSCSRFIGKCSLDPEQDRAEIALPSLQRLRILQRVTDLEVTIPGAITRPLNAEERALVRDHLYAHESITFTELRKLLGFPAKKPKSKDSLERAPFHEFNFEREDAKDRLIGDRTHCALAGPLGDAWTRLSLSDRDALVSDLLNAKDEDEAREWLVVRHGLTDEQAAIAAETPLETDRGRFCSGSAIKLCQLLDTKEDAPTRLSTALRKLRGDRSPSERAAETGLELLPPYLRTHPEVEAYHDSPYALRNPSILRVLRELRLVVNAIIRKHGKPDRIRIEFARELKNPARKRQEIARKQKERASERDAAREMLVELGHRPNRASVTASDIEKWLLGVECNWHCPYSGQPVEPSRVFKPNSDVQVEHIIPRALSLDNSFANKTLAVADWNARKARRSPHVAFSSSEEWKEILLRVSGFNGPGARGKLARFQWDEEELKRRYDGFTARHLQETAWAARLAKDYLATLYGASETDAIDATGTRRIETISGVATGLFRQAWNCSEALLQSASLPKLPPDAAERPKTGAGDKLRSDHRHHAIDALVVALTNPTSVAALSSALSHEIDLRNFQLPSPAPDFDAQLRQALEGIVVSHRVNRRAAGALHQATYYQAPRANGLRFQRVALVDLKADDIGRILDRRIQKAVADAWAKSTVNDPAKWFADPSHLPRLSPEGVIVKRVTLPIEKISTVALGPSEDPARQLHVKTGGNFCVVVVSCPPKTAKGKPYWEFRPITLLEAARQITDRLDQDNPTPLPPGKMLAGDNALKPGESVVFTIRSSEAFRLRKGDKSGIVVIGTASEQTLEGSFHNDARGDAIRKKLGAAERIRISPSGLQAADPQKVTIGPLGEIHVAND